MRAVTLDTTFALAYSSLFICSSPVLLGGIRPHPGTVAAAKQALDKAFALQPDLPEAYVYLVCTIIGATEIAKGHWNTQEGGKEGPERTAGSIPLLPTFGGARKSLRKQSKG